MREERISDAELVERLHECLAGERVVVASESARYPARIQHVGATGLKVIPEPALEGSHGAPGDIEGHMVSFGDIESLELGEVRFLRDH
ncbi:hypothetical protein IEI94_00425 [Halomonas sp. ML-15]|uniref:hypothetical protein n=1 Tax=Halomonas sp. ML-15 TaxID=2773305 RepID=UPI0017469F3B|nr:hypothetical protein [Halomonas sp. ML-15]MBD3894316.1 hypothetical protein [Halomonas sp. ML-15]